MECRTGVDGTLCPDPPAVAVDNALHSHQSDPCTWKIMHRMKPLESAEQLSRVGHIKADTIVAHEKRLTTVLAVGSKLD